MSARREHPAVTAAADQASAAAEDITRRVHAGYQRYAELEAFTSGSPPQLVSETGRLPAGPRGEVLEGIFRRFAAGELSGCPHAITEIAPGLARAGPRPRALVWLSWHPDLIICAPCAAALPGASPEEDSRCDGCGHVCAPGEPIEVGTYVLPCSARYAARSGHLAPPLICSFGLCLPCARPDPG